MVQQIAVWNAKPFSVEILKYTIESCNVRKLFSQFHFKQIFQIYYILSSNNSKVINVATNNCTFSYVVKVELKLVGILNNFLLRF